MTKIRRCAGFAALGLWLASCGGAAAVEQSAAGDQQAGGAPPVRAPVCEGQPKPLASAPCTEGYYYYTDKLCGPDPDGGFSCSGDAGDLLCHQTCTTDADCTDPCRPNCRTVGLFSGGDAGCNARVRLCGVSNTDQC